MFNYFGSKQRLASTYQPPTYPVIVEPFAGAAAYSMYWMRRRAELDVVLYDIDPLVCELWDRLLSMSPEELWYYPNPVEGAMSADLLWGMTASATSPWLSVAKGHRFQVTEWMARDFPEMKRRMADQLAHINPDQITVIHDSYGHAPDIEATWFIDPPYQADGHRYVSGNQLNFDSLGEWSRSRQGQVIVCESIGANWLDFTPHRQAQTQVNGSSTEVVWYSHPEPTLFDRV